MDKLLGYRNLTSATYSDEDFSTVPEINHALKQGYTNNYVLESNKNKNITIPTDAKFALFCANGDIWVRIGGTARIPNSDGEDGTGSELNPILRYLDMETAINIISESAVKVSIMFYK